MKLLILTIRLTKLRPVNLTTTHPIGALQATEITILQVVAAAEQLEQDQDQARASMEVAAPDQEQAT